MPPETQTQQPPGPAAATQNQPGQRTSPPSPPPGNQQQQPPGNQQQQQPPGNQQQPPKRTGTLYQDLGVEENEPGVVSPNWRQEWAGGDEKKLAILSRFTEPKALLDSFMAAQQRLRSGEYKRAAPPDGADEAAVKAWRQEQGIPDDPMQYPVPGVEIDKLDDRGKERVGSLNKTFQEIGLQSDAVKKIYEVYNAQVEKDAQLQAQGDARLIESTEDALRADWGRDYRANIDANIAFLDKTLGGDITDAILMARSPDGRLIMNTPEVAKWINTMARNAGGDFLDPGHDGGSKGSDQARMEEIKKIMNTDFARYQRENLGDEYGKILERLESRGKISDPAGPMS